MILALLHKRKARYKKRIGCFLRSFALTLIISALLLLFCGCLVSEASPKKEVDETDTPEIYCTETSQSEPDPVEYDTEETSNTIIDETDKSTESEYDDESKQLTEPVTSDTETVDVITETSDAETTETLPPVDEKVVYLTFDDGPSKKYTEAILDMLNAHGIKATFFVIGQNAKRYPSIVQRIVDEGHALGCHSMTHEIKSIYKSVDQFKSEIDDWEDTISDILGDLPPKKLIRLPGGSTSAFRYGEYGVELISYIKERGYYAYDWSAANGDKWEGDRKEGESMDDYLRRMIIETTEKCLTRGDRPCIILVHDTSPDTFDMIDWALTELQNRGYVFKTLYELDENYIFAKY